MKRLLGVKTLIAAVALALVVGFAASGALFAQAATPTPAPSAPADQMDMMSTPASGTPMAGGMTQMMRMMQQCTDMMQMMMGMMSGQMSGMGGSQGTPAAPGMSGMMDGTPSATPAS